MAYGLIQDSTLNDIAESIIAKDGGQAMTPSQMADRIEDIQTGGVPQYSYIEDLLCRSFNSKPCDWKEWFDNLRCILSANNNHQSDYTAWQGEYNYDAASGALRKQGYLTYNTYYTLASSRQSASHYLLTVNGLDPSVLTVLFDTSTDYTASQMSALLTARHAPYTQTDLQLGIPSIVTSIPQSTQSQDMMIYITYNPKTRKLTNEGIRGPVTNIPSKATRGCLLYRSADSSKYYKVYEDIMIEWTVATSTYEIKLPNIPNDVILVDIAYAPANGFVSNSIYYYIAAQAVDYVTFISSSDTGCETIPFNRAKKQLGQISYDCLFVENFNTYGRDKIFTLLGQTSVQVNVLKDLTGQLIEEFSDWQYNSNTGEYDNTVTQESRVFDGYLLDEDLGLFIEFKATSTFSSGVLKKYNTTLHTIDDYNEIYSVSCPIIDTNNKLVYYGRSYGALLCYSYNQDNIGNFLAPMLYNPTGLQNGLHFISSLGE